MLVADRAHDSFRSHRAFGTRAVVADLTLEGMALGYRIIVGMENTCKFQSVPDAGHLPQPKPLLLKLRSDRSWGRGGLQRLMLCQVRYA